MQVMTCDSKGRLYLKESIREKYGRRFLAVPAAGELLLLPLPTDAVADLREAARKARGLSLQQLRRLIADEATRQVVG